MTSPPDPPSPSSDSSEEPPLPLKWDAAGLVTVVVQDRLTGEVRMVAHANEEAVRATLRTGRGTFFSRSRGTLWEKGAQSGHTLHVSEVEVDCDADCLLYRCLPQGPSCHTGAESCFFSTTPCPESQDETQKASPWAPAPAKPQTLMGRLENELELRKNQTAAASYTKSLFEKGPKAIGDKVVEEASEFAAAVALESDDRVANEAADLLYHTLVGLRFRNIPWRTVLETLERRMGQSGHAEKASRSPKGR